MLTRQQCVTLVLGRRAVCPLYLFIISGSTWNIIANAARGLGNDRQTLEMNSSQF